MCTVKSVEAPVFVCQRCGKITRSLYHERGDTLHCPYCGDRMVDTGYSIYDDEKEYYFGDTEEAKQFRCDVFLEFVKHNERYDAKLERKRLDEEKADVYSKSDNVIPPKKRGPGRPRKTENVAEINQPHRRRGRPTKYIRFLSDKKSVKRKGRGAQKIYERISVEDFMKLTEKEKQRILRLEKAAKRYEENNHHKKRDD